MDSTLEDNVVDGLFFCTTLTGRRGGHTPFVQTRAETSDISGEAVEPDTGSSWESHSGRVDTGVWNKNAESCRVVHTLRITLMIRPLRRKYDVVARKTDELLCGGYKRVSRFETPCTALDGRVSA